MAPTPSGTKQPASPSWLKVAGLDAPLTAAEQHVLAALADGSAADVHSRGRRRSVRAGVIRAIAIGLALPVEQIDPRGAHIVGAVIADRIELDDVRFARPLRLIDCELAAGLSAERAELHLLELEDCEISAPASDGAAEPDEMDPVPAVMLDEVRVTHGVSLARSKTTGAVRLLGASIGGQLNCADGTFTNEGGSALGADGLTTLDVFLTGTFAGHGEDGTVRLLDATIGGQLHCTGDTFTNENGPALNADGLTTTGSVYLAGTFTGSGDRGAIRLPNANINGQLQCTGGTFTNKTGPTLIADGLRTNSVHLTGTFTGGGNRGAIRLPNANINGQLQCTGGTFTNKTGPTLVADGLVTTSDVHLASTFTGGGELGTIRLLGANIGGQLHCTTGTFFNQDGPALNADGLTTTSNIRLAGTFTGGGELGTVRFLGASIGGQLHCTDATLTNENGPALSADGLTTSSVCLAGTFTGNGKLGTVRLLGASIGGQLDCTDATLINENGPALSADGLTTASDVRLAGTFTGVGNLGTVRLLGATIGGQLQCVRGSMCSNVAGGFRLNGAEVRSGWVIDPAMRAVNTPERWLSIDGFTYAGTPMGWGKAQRFDALDWARLLATQTPSYAAQPYQQLAGAYRSAGHEHEAKAVLMAQQDDRRERIVKQERRRWRALGVRWRSVGMRLSKTFTGYGYQSWKALLWLLGLAAISVALAFVAGGVAIDLNTDPAAPPQATTVLAHKPTKTDAGVPCSNVELVGVGIDWAVPIVATKAGDACLLNSTHPWGQWWTGVSWVVHIIGWAFATLAVAGFTGLIRRL